MKNKKNKIILSMILLLTITSLLFLNTNQYFPLHVDEWFHIGVAKAIVANDFLPITSDPFTGIANVLIQQELAWHYLLALIAVFNPSIFVWKIFPPIMAILAVLSTFVFARRWGNKTGLVAAFLIALLPSNVTIGGFAFMVPINLFLIVAPVALLFAFDKDLTELKNKVILFILTLFLFLAHPPSAVILFGMLFVYALFCFKEDKQKSIIILGILFFAGLISSPIYLQRLLVKGIEGVNFPFWVYLGETAFVFGVIQSIIFIIAAYFIFKDGKKEEKTLIISILFLVFVIAFFNQTGTSFILPSQRAFLPAFLLMSIIMAVYLSRIENKKILGIILGIVLLTSIYAQINTPFYHVIEQEDYEAFLLIKENSNPTDIVLLDPWTARALTPIAERRVYTVLPFGPNPEILEKNNKAIDFIENKCIDTNFLITNNISIIYAPKGCNNSELKYLDKNVYFFKKS